MSDTIKVNIFVEDWEIETLEQIIGKEIESNLELERVIEHYLNDCLDVVWKEKNEF